MSTMNLSSIILTRINLMKQHQRHMNLFSGNHLPHLLAKGSLRHRNSPLIALVFLDLAGARPAENRLIIEGLLCFLLRNNNRVQVQVMRND